MTQQDAVQHWRKGAERMLKAAQDNFKIGNYEVCLFTCHLALEKQVKSMYMEKYDENAPKIHDLVDLCDRVEIHISKEEQKELKKITAFCSFARYGDETWLKEDTSKENVEFWLERSMYYFQQFSS